MPEKAKNLTQPQTVQDYASLVEHLMRLSPNLSNRLQKIAKFAINHPEDVALYNIVEIAAQAGVHPSAITRFAKELGFSGFSDMQSIFRQRLIGPKLTHAERMQALAKASHHHGAHSPNFQDPSLVFDMFVHGAMDALLRLHEEVDRTTLAGFVAELSRAQMVHIAAARGAFSVGAYCYYGLSRIGKRSCLMDNLGAMREQQLNAVGQEDIILAITFDDYTAETIEVVQTAAQQGRKLLIMTDNALSPVANLGKHTLYVKDARLGHFRSQVPAMILCQSIIVSLGSADT